MLPLALLLSVASPHQDDPVLLETVVTALRSARTITHSDSLVTVVAAEDLARTGERSLPRAIGAASGVWLQETNLGGGSAFLRGLTGNRVLILVDGVRLNDSTTRTGPNQSLNTIDPATVERVEIVRGPSSVLYGSDAIGGVISIWTKSRRPATADTGAAGLRAGADALYRSDVDGGIGSVHLSYAGESVGSFVSGTYFDYDDLETGDGETADFTGYDGFGLFASEVFQLGPETTLRSTASLHRDLDVPRTDRLVTGFGQTQPANQVFNFNIQERQRYQLTLDQDGVGGFADSLQSRLFYLRYEEERERLATGSTSFRFERDVVETIGAGLDFRRAVGQAQLMTWGLDVYWDEVDSSRTDTDLTSGTSTPNDGQFAPDSRYASVGLFVQDEIADVGGFDVTAGARYSYFDFAFDPFSGDPPGRRDGDFSAFTASLQLARNLNDHVRATATVAQGFRAPNLDDLAKNGSFAGGTELANPDLDPEQSLTGEIAFDAAYERWSGGTSAFFTGVSDVIGRVLVDVGDPTTTGDETFLRENVGNLDLYGVEAGGRVRLGEERSPFALALNVTFTKGRQYDDTVDPTSGQMPFDDVPVRRIPPLHGRAALEYRAAEPVRSLSWAELELVWADDQDDLHPQDVSDPRIDPGGTPGWAVLNLDLGGPLGQSGRASWRVGIHNLLDKAYRVHGSGFDGPGLGVVFGLHWSG